MRAADLPDEPADIGIPLDVLAFIVLKARAFDAEVDTVIPDEGSNEIDDRAVDVLESGRRNPNARELRDAIAGLSRDQQHALVALAWIGRGDYDADEWADALAAAASRAEAPTARYLMGMPLLGDFIEDGAAELGVSLTDEEIADLSDPST